MADDGNKAEMSSFLNSLSSHPAEGNETQNHSYPTSSSSLGKDQSFASSDLEAMIARFDHLNSWSLVKVPHKLRQVNEKAYVPQLISIGPYHRDNSHLAEMEVYKKRCLKMICKKKGMESVARCIQGMDIEKARKCYPPSLNLEWQALVEMILLDGCLIVELLCKRAQEIDPIFKVGWVKAALLRDMLLLENQLPFFVLVKLHEMIKDNSGDGKDFASQAFSVLSRLLPGPKNWIKNHPTIRDADNIKHLLSLVHDNWSPSPQGKRRHQYSRTREGEKETAGQKAEEMELQGDEENVVTNGKHRERDNVRKGRMGLKFIRCATELDEAGIKFESVGVRSNPNSTEDSNVKNLFDIRFTNGIMKVPAFVIDDHTERIFRNLIAYEQYDQNGSRYVIDYVILMDCLINSGKDVQLLRHSEVIESQLGDDEAVAQMINKLGEHVAFNSKTFCYKEIFHNVAKHCKNRWPRFRAKLLHDYFNSPWALISVLAATLIILLTIAQTVLSAISL